jgi:glutamate-1-semialdehyde 2,1-aminomutase
VQTYSFQRSQQLYARASRVIPAGIPGHFGTSSLVPPTAYPLYAESAAGAHFTDVDGNDIIDYMCAYGPMILGYGNKVVEEAAARQRAFGDTLGCSSPVMVELAERLTSLIAGADWAFFAKNGGDVTDYATMIARAATGRPLIVAIEDGYHGVAPWMQGPGRGGVVTSDTADVLRIPWNDSSALERVLDERPDQVAGFIATPYHHPAFCDSELPSEGYWSRIRELTTRHGVVLIVDDVRCGFRVDLAGSAHHYGFTPDLACYCKAIANGYPISALVGTEALRDDAAKVFYTGSYWYQAVPMAAAMACIAELERLDGPSKMQEYGNALTSGLQRLADDHGYKLSVTGVGSMPNVRLIDDTDQSNMTLHQRWCAECTRRGAYFTPHHNWFVSCAHTQEDLERTLAIANDAFAVLEEPVSD